MSKLEVNTIEPQCGTTLTLGGSGDTVTLASGASQSGFGRTGTVDWQTTVKTSGFTASDGEGYFCNTTSGGFTVNLPAGSAGSIVALKDYANTWDTGNLTITPNGSDKIAGVASSTILSTEAQSVTLIFTDSTRGWIDIHDSTSSVVGAQYVTATGGNTVITDGNFKTHVFTGPGTFCVSSAGNPGGSTKVDYVVIAGGGSGGVNCAGGGGGAGGFRLSNCVGSIPAPTMSPLVKACGALPVTATGYPITVGGGGAGRPASPGNNGIKGSDSVFSTITSTGGGLGSGTSAGNGGTGGSGGGGAHSGGCGASGNTPSVSPPQGNDGGDSNPSVVGGDDCGGGGGGAGAASDGSTNPQGGIGSYIADSFFGPTAPSYGEAGPVSNTRYFAGGGGGGARGGPTPAGSTDGGVGGGGNGARGPSGSGGPETDGAVNTGSGGGGAVGPGGGYTPSGGGGSGIVLIRYKFQN